MFEINKPSWKRFAHFFLASGFGTSIDFVAFNSLLIFGAAPVFANVISFFAGSISAFLALVWRSKRFIPQSSAGASFAGYLALGSISVATSSLVIHLVSNSTDSLLAINIAKLLVVGALFLAKYGLSILLVFKPYRSEAKTS